jgi:PAS domain S-box-containing protein
MKLLFKLAATIIVIMLISEALILYITWTSNVKTLDIQVKEKTQEIAYNNMDKIDRLLFERTADINIIASDPIITSRDSSPQQIVKRLIEYRDIYKTYVSLSFFDLNRVRIADTAGLDLGKQDDKHKYWDDILQDKFNIASGIDLDKSLSMPVIYFASPVKDRNSQPFGVVVTRISLDMLYEIIGNPSTMLQITGGMYIDLVDGDGLLVYSNYNRKGMLIEKTPYWEEVKNRPGEKIGTIEGYTGDEDCLLVFCREQGYLDFIGNGWTLMIHIPNRIVFAPLTELRNRWILVLLPSTILAVIIALFFSFKLSKPLTELRNAVSEVGKVKLDTRVKIRSRDEIGDLGDYFNKMVENLKRTTTSIDNLEREVTQRKQAEETLQQSEEKWHSLVENAPNIIMLVDRDRTIQFINHVIAGLDVKDVIGGSIYDYIQPESHDIARETIDRVFETGEPGYYEIKGVGPDGKISWYETTTGAIKIDEEVVSLIQISSDVTERKQTEEVLEEKTLELEKSNIRLQELDQLKSIFLASMSHELRTPLNSIIGFTSLIIDGMVGEINEEQRKQLTIVKSSSNHLLSMINDILDIAKIEAGKVELSLEEFGLENEITEVIELFSPIADLKGIEILRDTTEGITLFSDKRRLKQVLINLISNAVKFTDRGSVKLIARVMGDDTLEVKVVDTGIGITAEDISKLFAPFQQVDSALTKKHEGTGLGLHLSKNLLKLLGGEISVKSEYGTGSEFTFNIPLHYKEERAK